MWLVIWATLVVTWAFLLVGAACMVGARRKAVEARRTASGLYLVFRVQDNALKIVKGDLEATKIAWDDSVKYYQKEVKKRDIELEGQRKTTLDYQQSIGEAAVYGGGKINQNLKENLVACYVVLSGPDYPPAEVKAHVASRAKAALLKAGVQV